MSRLGTIAHKKTIIGQKPYDIKDSFYTHIEKFDILLTNRDACYHNYHIAQIIDGGNIMKFLVIL